jgi:hypothetical protein
MSTVRIKRKHVLDSDSDDDDDAPSASASVAVASVSNGSSEKENTVREKATTTQKGSSPHSPSRATMSTQSDMSVPDTIRPAFDPGLDIATVVFSHVQCVKTRHSLARVSKLWREASKPAAAYPRTFDLDAFPDMISWTRRTRLIDLLDNDEALSLPYERVVGLLGEAAEERVCNYAAMRGSVRLLKWTRENNRDWHTTTCITAAANGHLPALQYLHENGCPWDHYTCCVAAKGKHWDCLQYAVDNKCPRWDDYAETYAKHLR